MKTYRRYHRSSFIFWGVAFALSLFFCLVWGFKPSLAFGMVGSGGLLMLMTVQNLARKQGKPYLYQAGYAVFFGAVAVWSAWAIYTLQDRLGVALLGAFGLLSLYIALWNAWQTYKDYKLYKGGMYANLTLPNGQGITYQPPTFNAGDGTTYDEIMAEMLKANERFNRDLLAKALTDIPAGQPVYQKGEILYGDIDCTKTIGVVISTGSFEVKIRRPVVEPRKRGEDEFPYMYGMGKHNANTPNESFPLRGDNIGADPAQDYDPSGLDGKE